MDHIGRFWARVNKDGPLHPVLGTKCWIWMGKPHHSGYGVLTVMDPTVPKYGKYQVRVHRFSL